MAETMVRVSGYSQSDLDKAYADGGNAIKSTVRVQTLVVSRRVSGTSYSSNYTCPNAGYVTGCLGDNPGSNNNYYSGSGVQRNGSTIISGSYGGPVAVNKGDVIRTFVSCSGNNEGEIYRYATIVTWEH